MTTGEDPVHEMGLAVMCLFLEVNSDVAQDVKNRWHAVTDEIATLRGLLITACEKLVYMGYPIEDFPGMTPELLEATWKQVRDHESFS